MFYYAGYSDYGFLKIDENQCLTLFSCFLSIFTNIENDSTIEPVMDYGQAYFIIRSLWNAIFTVINKYIMKNLTAVVIIEGFASYRKALESQSINKENCFICNSSISSFEPHPENFHKHVNEEHNFWNYFYYISSILARSRDKKSLSSLDSYVLKNVSSRLARGLTRLIHGFE